MHAFSKRPTIKTRMTKERKKDGGRDWYARQQHEQLPPLRQTYSRYPSHIRRRGRFYLWKDEDYWWWQRDMTPSGRSLWAFLHGYLYNKRENEYTPSNISEINTTKRNDTHRNGHKNLHNYFTTKGPNNNERHRENACMQNKIIFSLSIEQEDFLKERLKAQRTSHARSSILHGMLRHFALTLKY